MLGRVAERRATTWTPAARYAAVRRVNMHLQPSHAPVDPYSATRTSQRSGVRGWNVHPSRAPLAAPRLVVARASRFVRVAFARAGRAARISPTFRALIRRSPAA